MKQASILLALAVALLAPSASASAAGKEKHVPIFISNRTGHCVWVTIYTAHLMSGWKIANSANARPRFLEPGHGYRFDGPEFDFGNTLPADNEVKARAEVMPGAACSGSRIYDTDVTQKDVRDSTIGYGIHWELLKGNSNFYFRK